MISVVHAAGSRQGASDTGGTIPSPAVRSTRSAGRRRWRAALVHLPAAAVLVVGLVVTAVMTGASGMSYSRTERARIQLEASLGASVLQSTTADLQRRLRPSSILAAYGHADTFPSQLGPSVGSKGPFVGAVLVRLGPTPTVVASVGTRLDGAPPDRAALSAISDARAAGTVGVVRLTGAGYQRLGYAVTFDGPDGAYATYAEQALPADRRVAVDPTNPASRLYIAIYYGRRATAASLLETNAPHLPLSGDRYSESFAVGTATVTLVVSAKSSLTGTFAADQAAIIAGGGSAITVLAAALVEMLSLGRRRAERRASRSRRVAEALQQSLLPRRIPDIEGMEIAARYRPSTAGISVGGDWYGAVEVDGRVYFSVGDVAGHGLEAATMMGRLRTAVEAYMTDGDRPDEVLGKLARLVDMSAEDHFATVVCGCFDPVTGELAFANAGHPPPILVVGGAASALDGDQGPPIGIGRSYRLSRTELPRGATLVVYTDGLVERRGDSISAGIERLRRAATADLPLDRLLDSVLADLVPGRSADDIAILALRRPA